MEKLTIEEMDNLLEQSNNHKIKALFKNYKSIEFFSVFHRDLVATHFGYKAVKRTETTYINNATGQKMKHKEVEEVVCKSAESNYKIDLLLKTKPTFSKLSMYQKKLILDYIGISIEQKHIFHFKRIEG